MNKRTMLDNDYYKFLMQARILEDQWDHDKIGDFPWLPSRVRYKLFNRGGDSLLVPSDEFESKIESMFRGKKLTEQELAFLETVPGLSSGYISWLNHRSQHGFNVDYNIESTHRKDLGFTVREFEFHGSWLETILFEVPLMALISEIHFKNLGVFGPKDAQFNARVAAKNFMEVSPPAKIAEFGTRRRYSFEVHSAVNQMLIKHENYVGTSNMHFSRLNGTRPVGTIAHEWFLANYAQLIGEATRAGICQEDKIRSSLMTANTRAWNTWIGLDDWGTVKRADLQNNTAVLTDTFTSDIFFRDMHSHLGNIRKFRHDSGDWDTFLNKLLKAHKDADEPIDGKTVIFSDSLDAQKVHEISTRCRERNIPINVLFGVGTKLTNGFGVRPLNIVIKPTEFDGVPVLKLSDDPGKVTGSNTIEAKMIRLIAEEMNERN